MLASIISMGDNIFDNSIGTQIVCKVFNDDKGHRRHNPVIYFTDQYMVSWIALKIRNPLAPQSHILRFFWRIFRQVILV